MSIMVLLAEAKTWFLSVGLGMKAAVIATGTAVVVGIVAVPVVIFTVQDNNSGEVSTDSQTTVGEGVELSAEQQEYCNNMLAYMTNNNGKVPEGENREAVMALCYGESGNASSSSSGTMIFSSLEEASMAKWEAEHCTNYYDKNTSMLISSTCDTAQPWRLPENVTSLYNLRLGYCADWNEGRTQPTNIDCYAHGASWVDELAFELSNKSDWTEDMKSSIDPNTLLEPIPGTEHGYKLYEGDPNPTFPKELLRTDCEKVIETVPMGVEWDNDGNATRMEEATLENWVCPTLMAKSVFE